MTAVARTVTKPTPFDFEDHPVRIIVIDGEPWFVAADVCQALGYQNPRDAVATHLDDDERGVAICDTPSSNRFGSHGTAQQKLTIISESGMYTLVLRSHKPAARKFAKWVTREVLPQIRKTGSYGEPDRSTAFDPEDLLFWAARQGDCTGLEFSPALTRAIELKAHSLSYEIRGVIVAHLRGRVAYSCAGGYPERVIDEEAALQEVERGGIGHALAYEYYKEIGMVKLFSEMAQRVTQSMTDQIDLLNAKIGKSSRPDDLLKMLA